MVAKWLNEVKALRIILGVSQEDDVYFCGRIMDLLRKVNETAVAEYVEGLEKIDRTKD